MTNWRTIDSAPESGTMLLWDGAMVCEGILEDGAWYALGCMPLDGYPTIPLHPTHWMPLPDPPQE